MKYGIALCALTAVALVAYAQNSTNKLEGKTVPAFTMKTTDGKTISDKSLRGKVVLVDFWATWCGPCKAASPTMQELHKAYSRQGLTVIGANALEDDAGPNPARKYKADNKYTFTFTYDNDKIAEAWGVSGIPQFVLIDRKGKVRDTWFGFNDSIKNEIKAKVKAVVAEK